MGLLNVYLRYIHFKVSLYFNAVDKKKAKLRTIFTWRPFSSHIQDGKLKFHTAVFKVVSHLSIANLTTYCHLTTS